MKNITNNIVYICFLYFSFIIVISCDEKGNTNDSNLEVQSDVLASIKLELPLLSNQIVKEGEEGLYKYTISLNKSQVVPITIYVKQIGGEASEEDFEFDKEIKIPAYTTTASGTIKILSDDLKEKDENIVLQIGDEKTANSSFSPVKISFIISDCFSSLGGKYSYVTTNCYSPGPPIINAAGPFTGTVEFKQTSDISVYEISDASFGGWLGLYGPATDPVNNTANGVSLKDLCGKISLEGKDQANEVFTLSNLLINGSEMSFRWQNDYGEYGQTTLKRDDGTNWPPLTLQ
jgi:hypothetical protein